MFGNDNACFIGVGVSAVLVDGASTLAAAADHMLSSLDQAHDRFREQQSTQDSHQENKKDRKKKKQDDMSD